MANPFLQHCLRMETVENRQNFLLRQESSGLIVKPPLSPSVYQMQSMSRELATSMPRKLPDTARIPDGV